jgi:hypothetical protein
MRTSNLFLAACAAASLAGCGIGAPQYPTFGETAYRIEGQTADVNGGAPTRTVIYRDGAKMRVEAVLPNYGQAAIVFDEATNAAYVLNPTTGAAMATSPTAPGAVTPAPGAPTTTPPAAQAPATTTPGAAPAPTTAPPAGAVTAAPAQVQGVAVRIDDADAPQPLETAWAALGEDNARSGGRCEVAGETGHQWRPREETAGVERIACITEDGIVLRVTENGRALWEATSVQRGPQDAALFGVPAGYQLIDPQRVAEEVGQNMEQLDSVTGATQQPPAQTTPAPRG